MAKKKLKPKPVVYAESWRLEDLRARFKTMTHVRNLFPQVELWMQDVLSVLSDREVEGFAQEQRLADCRKALDAAEDQVSDIDSELASAARAVIALVPVALGIENAVTESVAIFNLRRAVEDLSNIC